jgi:hypothetical protein
MMGECVSLSTVLQGLLRLADWKCFIQSSDHFIMPELLLLEGHTRKVSSWFIVKTRDSCH